MRESFTNRQVVLLSLLAIFLSSTTILLGAPLFRVVRKYGSAKLYYVIGLVATVCLWFFGFKSQAVIFMSLFLLVGFYTELENRDFSRIMSGTIACFLAVINAVSVTMFWARSQQINILTITQEYIAETIKKLAQVNSNFVINADVIFMQIPSLIVAIMIISLALALILERPIGKVVHINRVNKAPLSAFRLPDLFIWPMLFSFLFSFLNFKIQPLEIVSVNLLNILIVLYFFQGLAIVAYFFKHFQVETFWRVGLYIILVGQLFLFVSLLGVADYWLDFRTKIANRAKKIKNHEAF